jgi:hypothetical protein
MGGGKKTRSSCPVLHNYAYTHKYYAYASDYRFVYRETADETLNLGAE